MKLFPRVAVIVSKINKKMEPLVPKSNKEESSWLTLMTKTTLQMSSSPMFGMSQLQFLIGNALLTFVCYKLN